MNHRVLKTVEAGFKCQINNPVYLFSDQTVVDLIKKFIILDFCIFLDSILVRLPEFNI